MTVPAIKLNTRFSNLALPSLDGPAPVAPGSYIEDAAVGHWIFGGSEALSYEDITGNGNTLTESVTAPTIASNYLTIANQDQRLDTGIGTGSAITLATVVRVAANREMFFLGAFGTTSGGGKVDLNSDPIDGGGVIFADSDGSNVGVFTNADYTPGSATGGAMTGATASLDTWFFVAYSVSATEKLLYQPYDATTFVSGTGGDPTITTGQTNFIGNGHYSAGFAQSYDIAEAIIIPAASDQSAMLRLYHNSRARMAQRGIAI